MLGFGQLSYEKCISSVLKQNIGAWKLALCLQDEQIECLQPCNSLSFLLTSPLQRKARLALQRDEYFVCGQPAGWPLRNLLS